MNTDEEITVLRARVRLMYGIVQMLTALAPAKVFNGIVEALEAPDDVEGDPDLARSIDEQRQQLAAELRQFRESLEAAPDADQS